MPTQRQPPSLHGLYGGPRPTAGAAQVLAENHQQIELCC
jgi:hypothetical protein